MLNQTRAKIQREWNLWIGDDRRFRRDAIGEHLALVMELRSFTLAVDILYCMVVYLTV